MRLLVRSLLLLALIVAPLSQLWAGDVLDRIAKSNTLRIGMTGTQEPFNFVSRDKELLGMEVDLARLLAGAMEVELKLEQMPFADLLPALAKGKVDLVMSGMTATLERNRRVAFVGPYYISGKSILAKASTLAQVQQQADTNLASLSMVALRGSTSERFIQRHAPGTELVLADDYPAAVELLLNDRVQAFLADGPILKLTAMRHPDANLAALRKPLTIEPIGIAVPPEDMLLLNLVQNYMRALESSGGLDVLRKKWFENGSWLVQLP